MTYGFAPFTFLLSKDGEPVASIPVFARPEDSERVARVMLVLLRKVERL